METVIQIFKQIQETSGTNDKKATIISHKDNECFKMCLKFLLDSNIVTGISEAKLSKKVLPVRGVITDFEGVINYLATHNTGTDNDIAIIQQFINSQPEEHQEFYSQMVTKKLRLGADAKVVNKCIPGLIPTFNVQLGTSIDKVRFNGDETIFITQKMNGTRCSFVNGKLMTRQGKVYTGLDHIINDLYELVGENMFIDGELIYGNKEGLTDSEAFQKGTGIAMSKDEDKSMLSLVIFDILPIDEFWNGISKDTYSHRRKMLNLLAYDIDRKKLKNVSVTPCLYRGNDHTMIWEYLDMAEQYDWEGIMLNLDTPYECKRTKKLIKVKKFKEIDLRCIAVNIATSGKYKGLMGSITCKYGDSTVDVGSGFSDEARKHYTNNPQNILNHIIAIKYKEETQSKTGNKSLQFPVFIACRDSQDKNIADDEV